MISLPTIEQDSYKYERVNNDTRAVELFTQLFPDISIPYEYAYDMLKLLEQTRVNARIIPEVIRGVHNLCISERRGQVIVHVQKELTNIQVRENSETIKTLGEDLPL